jgi:hypothetical protein
VSLKHDVSVYQGHGTFNGEIHLSPYIYISRNKHREPPRAEDSGTGIHTTLSAARCRSVSSDLIEPLFKRGSTSPPRFKTVPRMGNRVDLRFRIFPITWASARPRKHTWRCSPGPRMQVFLLRRRSPQFVITTKL